MIARTDADAKRAALIGGVAALPIWALFWFLGALLWAYYQGVPGGVPAEIAADQSRVVPHYVLSEFPAVMLGLLVAGLTAAAMSSLDSDINSVATVVVEDLYQRARPQASDRESLRVGKIVVFAAGTLCVLGSLLWIGVESAVGFMFDLISVATAGVLGLFLLGILFRGATSRGAVAGIVAAVLFTAWATFTAVELPALDRTLLDIGAANYPWNPKLIGVISSLLLLAVGLPGSYILGGPKSDAIGLTVWSRPDTSGTSPHARRAEAAAHAGGTNE